MGRHVPLIKVKTIGMLNPVRVKNNAQVYQFQLRIDEGNKARKRVISLLGIRKDKQVYLV